jgi:hypothetical protein
VTVNDLNRQFQIKISNSRSPAARALCPLAGAISPWPGHGRYIAALRCTRVGPFLIEAAIPWINFETSR